MMGINEMPGIQPELRKYLDLHEKLVSGEVKIVCTPSTCGSSAAAVASAISSTAAKYNRKVIVALTDSAGEVVGSFQGKLTIAATKSSTSGTIAIEGGGTTVQFKNGYAEVVLKYTGTWASADTATLTVSGSVAGKSLTSKTSVDTLVA